MIARLISRMRARRDHRRWLGTPAGCCECGTGGPYYRGSDPQVTRYLYSGATAGGAGQLDWSACSAHPCPGLVPLVDYGTDRVVTFRKTEADATAALVAVVAYRQAVDDQDDDPTGEGRAAADDYLREPDTDPDDDDLADFDREVSEGWVDDSGLAVEWAEAAEDFVANLPADQDDGDSPEVTS